MCSVCGAINGHLPGCPEAPEPPLGGKERCVYCGQWVYDNDSVWFDPKGECYHQNCFENNVFDILEKHYRFSYEDYYWKG